MSLSWIEKKPYIILIVIITFAFLNSLQNSFVWDDYGHIVDNPKIALPLKDILSVFITPMWGMVGFTADRQDYYRPIANIFFVLNYKIWGLNPAGFHLTVIIFHIIIALILYRIGLLLLNNEKLLSLIAASIFAVHPVHNEPVGRAASYEVVFGLFIIFSVYFFLKDKMYLSWIAFFLALLSKEAAIMLPLALAMLAFDKNNLRKSITVMAPYIVLAGIYLILRMQIVDTVFGIKIAQPAFIRILTMEVSIMDYVRLLLIPYPLSPFYPARWYASVFEPKVVFSMIFFAAILFIVFKIRKDRVMFFLFLFPLIMLLPVILRANTFPVGNDLVYIAERFLYVPAMMFSLFIVACIFKLGGEAKRKYVPTAGIIVICTFAVLTIYSSRIWANNITLFEKIAEESPGIGSVHNNLGNAYMLVDRYFEAIGEYKKAIALDKNNIEAYYNLGVSLDKAGLSNQAVYYYDIFCRNASAQYSEQKTFACKRIDSIRNGGIE